MFAFMSIYAWPEGWSIDRMIESLVAAMGMDPYDAALRVRRPPPLAVRAMPVEAARDALRVFKKLGVTAFAPTQEHLDLVPPPLLAKTLTPALGAPEPMWTCELWRRGAAAQTDDDQVFGLLASQIRLIIRAKLVDRERGETEVHVTTDPFSGLPRSDVVKHPGKIATTDLLDLYCFDAGLVGNDGQDKRVSGWRRARLSGDKFNFASLLGAQRAYSDNENADRAALALGAAAKSALIETGYPAFQPPAGSHNTHVSGPSGTPRNAAAARFEFYSAWVYLRERTVGTLSRQRD